MWFRFFTLKYIEINGHGFLISNFICINIHLNFSNNDLGEVQDWGHSGVQVYWLKFMCMGKKSCAEYDASYLVNSMKGMNNYCIKDTVS